MPLSVDTIGNMEIVVDYRDKERKVMAVYSRRYPHIGYYIVCDGAEIKRSSFAEPDIMTVDAWNKWIPGWHASKQLQSDIVALVEYTKYNVSVEAVDYMKRIDPEGYAGNSFGAAALEVMKPK